MKKSYILLIFLFLVVGGCAPLTVNYTSDVGNPVRVKANIFVKFNQDKLSPDFQEQETKQSIVDAIRKDLNKNLFYSGKEDVDVLVTIEKLDYLNSPWGLIWFPLIIVGAPVGRLEGSAIVQLDIRSPKGQLLRSYREEKTKSLWYNTVFYNKGNIALSDGGITRDALKSVMEEIKYHIIEDRYTIVQLLENPLGETIAAGGLAPVVPASDVDFNIPKTRMHSPDAVAVVIGISNYQDPDVPRIEHARQDAAIMRQYLVNVLGYDEKNILPRDPDQVITAGVFKTMIRQQLSGYIKPGESDVFVYYSGHGAPSTAAQKAFFVPADCNPNYVSEDNGYLLNSFYDDLAKLHCKSLTVVIDACFSGFSGGGGMIIKNASPLSIHIEHPLLSRDNVIIFTASLADQVSNWYPEKRHGLFTYFFLKGLQGAADSDNDGIVTINEMERYLLDENATVPYVSRREFQRPQMPQVLGKEKQRVMVIY